MQKFVLRFLLILTLLGPSIVATAAVKPQFLTSDQSAAKTGANYEFITITANYVNGMWFVNGRHRPIIKTSMTKRNYLQIKNESASTYLNFLIPKIGFDVIEKNGVVLQKTISINENSSGKRILWLEPNSSMTISFVNDLSSTPLQAIVSVTRHRKEVIAIFGPDPGKKFTLPILSDEHRSNTKEAPTPEIGLRLNAPEKIQSDITILKDTNASLLASRSYKIIATQKSRTLQFSEYIWIEYRNSFVGGSNYFAKELKVYPGEVFNFNTLKPTVMRADND